MRMHSDSMGAKAHTDTCSTEKRRAGLPAAEAAIGKLLWNRT
jgi:hypothetical protein